MKKNILLSKNIKFKNNIDLGEDIIFNLDYLRYTKNQLIFFNKYLYTYVLRKSESLDNRYQENLLDK